MPQSVALESRIGNFRTYLRSRRHHSRRQWATRFSKLNAKRKTFLQNHTLDTREWISHKLRKRVILSYMGLNCLFIIVIVILWVLSKNHQGFVKAIDSSKSFLELSWGFGIFWTSVPAFAFQLHSLGYGMIVAACLYRQPFIELKRGADAEQTVFLNYLSLLPWKCLYRIWINKHWTLLCSACIAYFFTGLVVPLSSRLFAENSYTFDRPVKLLQNTTFQLSYQPLLTLDWDLVPVLGAASATVSFGAKYPEWSNNRFAFQGFSSPDKTYNENAQPNITAVTWAFGADLDCVSFDSSQYQHSISDGTLFLSATDRGCNWSASLTTSAQYSTYLQTQSNVGCPSYNGSNGSGRLIVLGIHSPVSFDDLTVLSCIPRYTKYEATLTLGLTGINEHSIVDVQLNQDSEGTSQPEWWNSFETQLSQVVMRNPTQTLGEADSTNFLGRLILDDTRKVHAGDNVLGARSLIESSKAVFSAAYATLLVSQLTTPAATPIEINGTLAFMENRVSIVDFVAWLIVGALVLATGNLLQLWLYTRRHKSVLREEVDDLVSYGGILFNSAVMQDVEAARNDTLFNGQTAEVVRRHLNSRYRNHRQYQMEKVQSLKDAHIIRK